MATSSNAGMMQREHDPVFTGREALGRDLLQLLVGAEIFELQGALGNLPESEILQRNPSTHELSVWLQFGYEGAKTYPEEDRDARISELDEAYMRLAPLEFAEKLPELVLGHKNPGNLLAYLPVFEEIFDDSPAWEHVRLAVFALAGVAPKALEAARGAIAAGGSLEETVAKARIMLTLGAYLRFGFERHAAIPDPLDVKAIYSTYISRGSLAAIDELNRALAATEDEVRRPFLASIGLELALTHDDPTGQLQNYIEILKESRETGYIFRSLGGIEPHVADNQRHLIDFVRSNIPATPADSATEEENDQRRAELATGFLLALLANNFPETQ